jgi:hypothetical protein
MIMSRCGRWRISTTGIFLLKNPSVPTHSPSFAPSLNSSKYSESSLTGSVPRLDNLFRKLINYSLQELYTFWIEYNLKRSCGVPSIHTSLNRASIPPRKCPALAIAHSFSLRSNCGRWRKFGQEHFCRRRSKNFSTLDFHPSLLGRVPKILSIPPSSSQ